MILIFNNYKVKFKKDLKIEENYTRKNLMQNVSKIYQT